LGTAARSTDKRAATRGEPSFHSTARPGGSLAPLAGRGWGEGASTLPEHWRFILIAQTRGEAPSPSLRSTSPRVRGEVKTSDLVLAVRSAPELLFKNRFPRPPHRSSPENTGGGCRSPHDPCFEHSQERTEESKEAERRETRSPRSAPSGVRRAQSAARSPFGVPPRHLLQRANATAQPQLRAS